MAIVSVRPVPHQERGCAHGCFNVVWNSGSRRCRVGAMRICRLKSTHDACVMLA